MVYGPCGGVTVEGGCEVDAALPCPFVDAPTVRWAGPAQPRRLPTSRPGFAAAQRTRARQHRGRATRRAPRRRRAHPAATRRPRARPDAASGLPWPVGRPLVLADLPTAPLYRSALLRSADLLADGVDAVLIGDHPGARVQFPPSYRALLLRDRGVGRLGGVELPRPQPGRPGGRARRARRRGRSRRALRHGRPHRDGPPPRRRPGVRPRRHAPGRGSARAAGLLVSVAESPCAPPAGRRPARLAEKVRAGAQVCIVNHAGGRAAVAEFVAVRTGHPVHRVRARGARARAGAAARRLPRARPAAGVPRRHPRRARPGRRGHRRGRPARRGVARRARRAGRRPRRRTGQGRRGRDLPGPGHGRPRPPRAASPPARRARSR